MTPLLPQIPMMKTSNIQSDNFSKDINVGESPELIESAKAFEAAFIAQMLTFSGLGKALTLGGGDEMSAFSSFYIESLAEKISDQGGFGLAKQFYANLSEKSKQSETQSVNISGM